MTGEFENHGLPPAIRDTEQGDLSQRRERLEPIRLVGEIDIDPVETDGLFSEGDGRPLHIGAKVVAHQDQGCQFSLRRQV